MRLNLRPISLFLMTLIPATLFAQQEQEPIRLTFEGVGESKNVESVKVENLTQETTLTIDGTDILVLNGEATGIEDVEGGAATLTRPLIYPNPAQTDANLVFDAPNAGKVSIKIFNTGGALVDAADVNVTAGRNAVRIPTQGYGFFIVRVDGVGIHYSQKWMSGAPKSNSRIEHIGMSTRELPTVAPLATRATALTTTQKSINMQFKPGDVLRFTGKSGDMTTIVMRKPTLDHTVSFQFFKCQDADGYNYPIIEAGGMLWMAEDLHLVKKSGLALMASSEDWSDPDASDLRMAYAKFSSDNADKGAYYTPRAAVKALPEGWRLPTADELFAVCKTYEGQDKAGKYLKAHGEDGSWNSIDYGQDEIQLNLRANGFLQSNGTFRGIGNTANIVTRSFRNGAAHIMKLQDGSDAAQIDENLLAKAGEGFTVRGVRTAMSPYNGFISKWLEKNPENKPQAISVKANGMEGNPFYKTAPLGGLYKMSEGIEQYYLQDKMLEGKDPDDSGITQETAVSPYFHRVVGQDVADGLQRTIYVQWDRKATSLDGIGGAGTVTMKVSDNKKNGYREITRKQFGGFTMYEPAALIGTPAKNEEVLTTYFRKMESYQCALQVHCGDFNGDTIDDILIAVSGRVLIIDGTDYSTILANVNFGVNGPCMFMTCDVGDINKDGKCDLAMVYAKDDRNVVEVYHSGLENLKNKNYDFRGVYAKVYGKPSGIVVGDIDNDNTTDILMVCASDVQGGYNWLDYNILTWNNKLQKVEEFKRIQQYHIFGNSDCGLEPVLVKSRGLGYAPDVYVDCGIDRWDPSKQTFSYLTIIDAGDGGLYSQKTYFGSGNTVALNIDGNSKGKESLVMMTNWLVGFDPNSKGETPFIKYNNLYVYEPDASGNWEKAIIKVGWIEDLFNYHATSKDGKWTSGKYSCNTLGKVRASSYLRELKLTGIETTISEPRIYSLLAAPPYWASYKERYEDAPGTSWGYANAEGTGQTQSSEQSATMVAGFEQEFNIPLIGTTIGSIDFETQMKWGWEQMNEKTTVTSFGQDYTTMWDDAVILTLTPFTAFTYTISKSSNPDDIGNELLVGVPDVPRNMPLSLNDYMQLRADNAAIPNLKMLFQHKVGDPFSYKEEYINAMPSRMSRNSEPEILWGHNDKDKLQDVGSVAAVSRSIEITQEEVNESSNSFEMDMTLVTTLFGAKMGGGYGYNNKNGIQHIESKGHTISGTIVPPVKIGDVPNFRWNVCRKNVKFEGQEFPVVTYMVRQ